MFIQWKRFLIALAVFVNISAFPVNAAEQETVGTQGKRLTPSEKAEKCKADWQRYRESQECFAPYVTVRGRVKAEAFEHCTEILDPGFECGPQERN